MFVTLEAAERLCGRGAAAAPGAEAAADGGGDEERGEGCGAGATDDDDEPPPLPRAVAPTLVDALRGPRGVRLENCRLNTGRALYAFSALQRTFLPKSFRPPEGTAGGGQA